ncbi:ig-like domain-containing protein [Trichonephila clavipes]|nr:ig-like domain-containing protein [Trichonephila clavipes]
MTGDVIITSLQGHFHDEKYPEIHAVIGSTVSLPCNLSPPSNDDVISLVLWYRLDLPNPIYTLDARSAPSADMVKHFSGKVLGSRAYFNVSRRSLAHLKIDPVDEDDAGEYRCRVDFKRGRTLSRLVKLNVIAERLWSSTLGRRGRATSSRPSAFENQPCEGADARSKVFH